MINLIDQHGKFNEEVKQIQNSIGNISIFGSQSSGKSTLINNIFNTHFTVLDSKQQRKRCTKGTWLQNNGKFNIIDTEGFDSVERIQIQRILQRQIALFCLAVSDVIIINLWMNQIGRYQGAQIHILKAIINAANYLIKSQTKTLLFVVKDCSRDANHDILKQQLENQVNKIIAQCPVKGSKSLKFNLEYYFMSHYVYYPELYEKQAEKLANTIRVRKTCLSAYQPSDRLVYLHHLWQTITKNDGQIDLRQQQQAIRSYTLNRILKQSQQTIQSKIKQKTRIDKLNSYEHMYQYYIKLSFEQIKIKLPKYTDQKIIKTLFCTMQQNLQYTIQKQFSDIILPIQQQYLLHQVLYKELKNKINTLQLQKIITQHRKKVIQLYRLLVQGHKQSQILISRFAQKITEVSACFQTQVSHLFNMFQMKLQNQVNKQIDNQIKNIRFDGTKIAAIFKKLCKQFKYNQWEVNAKQIWERIIHRTLTQKLPQKIQFYSVTKNQSILSLIFRPDNETSIIRDYKNLQKKSQIFIKDLLKYFEQEDTSQQYVQISKQKLRQGLQYALNEQHKQFRVSLLMLGIFFMFCYGEFMYMLKVGGVRKRMRRNLSYLYIAVVGIIVIGSILKKLLRGQTVIHPNII